MRSLSILVLFAALILGSSALPPTADEASVLIGLRHSTPERGLAALLAISDPKNPRYGLHLSPQQVAEEWGYPSPKESALLIRAVQLQHGGRQVILSPSRDFIRAIIPRASIASLSQYGFLSFSCYSSCLDCFLFVCFSLLIFAKSLSLSLSLLHFC